ncbi:MAG: hypothetical protein ACR2HS_03140, partial [Gammaproteobacteria bacterium]
YEKNGDLILTLAQEQYAIKEVQRCKNGVWAIIGGKERYISGKYYFYLQYYTLEDGNSPDFREADRLYFLFLMYWENIDWCLGNIRTKKRRQGASSQSCSNLLYEAIFYKNSNCGLISKTKEDSKDTFTQMVTFAYRQLPVFLKPKQINKEDSVTELVFAHKASNSRDGIVSSINKEEGHGSRINYKAPVLNAYDRGRMSRVLGDEFGKLAKEVPASQLLAIISKTLVKGVKKVGWIDMPSTTNDMTKGGGEEYYKIWKNADQFKRKPTLNRIGRFYQPAYEAYEGFIDEYGDSVIDAPTEEQYQYLISKWVKRDYDTNELTSELSEDDIKLGAKHYVSIKRREGLEGKDLEEEIRMNPCNEDEAFQSTTSDCHFNSINIHNQRKRIEREPPILRRITFFRNLDQSVGWRDDENGYWQILSFPEKTEQNKYKIIDNLKTPLNISKYVIGADGFSASQGGRQYGSNACAFVMDREKMQFIAMYFGRPRTKELFHEQMMLASEFYGCKIWIEKTADSYYEYFKDRGKIGYLGKYPKTCIPIEKRATEIRYYGFPINPFAMTRQLDNLIAYVDDDKISGTTYCKTIWFDKLLEQMLPFEAENRTAFDAVVASMITLCCALEPVNVQIKLKEPLVKTYVPNLSN